MNQEQIILKKLSAADIEKVRVWRNQEFVRQHMEYQKIISKEEQLVWFEKINSDASFQYFLVVCNEKPIGLIHLGNINKDTKSADVGLFIGEQDYLGTGAALTASIKILDLAFVSFELENLFAKVNSINIKVKEYNSFLGFVFDKKLSPSFEQWKIDKPTYFGKRERLQRLDKK